MPQREDAVRLHHMLDAAKEAFSFVQGKERGDLDKDRKLVLSLVRLVEVIGEAAGQVSKELQTAHPEIPWPAIVGMRNRLIHAYFDIDLDGCGTRSRTTFLHSLPVWKKYPRDDLLMPTQEVTASGEGLFPANALLTKKAQAGEKRANEPENACH